MAKCASRICGFQFSLEFSFQVILNKKPKYCHSLQSLNSGVSVIILSWVQIFIVIILLIHLPSPAEHSSCELNGAFILFVCFSFIHTHLQWTADSFSNLSIAGLMLRIITKLLIMSRILNICLNFS